MTSKRITYTLTVRFGSEVLTTKKNDFSDVNKLCEAVLDLGGSIIEIEVEELPKGGANNGD